MLTAEQLQKIEQDAKQATPGPYVADNDNICVPDEDHDFGFRTIAEVWTCGYRDVPPMTALDAIYFANLDPQTIMELVKMARRYLWLRQGKSYRLKCKKSDIYIPFHNDKDYGDTLDVSIDAALANEYRSNTTTD